MQEKKNTNTNPPKRSKAQRIAALICVILLAGLYLATLAVAIFDHESSGQWFLFCFLGTIIIPILTWIYIWMYGVLTNRHTIASFDLNSQSAPSDEDTESNPNATEE